MTEAESLLALIANFNAQVRGLHEENARLNQIISALQNTILEQDHPTEDAAPKAKTKAKSTNT